MNAFPDYILDGGLSLARGKKGDKGALSATARAMTQQNKQLITLAFGSLLRGQCCADRISCLHIDSVFGQNASP